MYTNQKPKTERGNKGKIVYMVAFEILLPEPIIKANAGVQS